MPSMLFVLVVALVVVLLVLRLLRSRALREKYAALWIVVGLATVILVAFPGLLDWAADVVGFTVPSNLLFLLSVILLLAVALQLSHEISVLEDETRMLAEESAIHRLTITRLEERITALEGAREHDPRAEHPRAVRSDADHVVRERAE